MLKQKNNKILLYGGKSTAYIVNSMLKDTKVEPSYIFDQYLKEPFFSSKAKHLKDSLSFAFFKYIFG